MDSIITINMPRDNMELDYDSQKHTKGLILLASITPQNTKLLTELGCSPSKTSILHEATHHKFSRTSSGRIFEKDIKDIFSLLIISLRLERDGLTNYLFNSPPIIKLHKPLRKSYPYSFSLESAIEKMKDLQLDVELVNTVTCISYSFKSEVSLALIEQFYKARLLHSPADRTRSGAKSNVALQPTPKGIAIVQEFCERIGMEREEFPEVLLAHDFNTMELFNFDRDTRSDRILYSEYLLYLLFNLMMGPEPNVWTPSNTQDALPSLNFSDSESFDKLYKVFSNSKDAKNAKQNNDDSSDVEGFSFTSYRHFSKTHQSSETHSVADSKEMATSPFHHRYFTNPESDAHSQYYVSSVGVRLLKDKIVLVGPNKSVTVDYCISGKAIYQWILDCTDIINPNHAHEIARLLVKHNLIKPVSFSSSLSFSRDAFYQLSTLGLALSLWDFFDRNLQDSSSLQPGTKILRLASNVTLQNILNDPGMRLQFRKHLIKDHCVENLEAYIQLMQFEETYKAWEDLSDIIDNKNHSCIPVKSSDVNMHLKDLQVTCMSFAFQIFHTYLSIDSPKIVNIDFRLRSKITTLMIGDSGARDNGDNESIIYLQTPTEDFALGSSVLEEAGGSTPRCHDHDELSAPAKNFRKIANLLLQIKLQIYHLMEVDSIPKFLETLGVTSNRIITTF